MDLILTEIAEREIPEWDRDFPVLASISHRATRNLLYFLIGAESAWSGRVPVPVACTFDMDSMGGLEWRVEMTTGRGRLTLAYRQSIRESWSSIECHEGEGMWDSPHGPVGLDANLVGTGRLRLSLPPLPAAATLDLTKRGNDHFARVETADAYWARLAGR